MNSLEIKNFLKERGVSLDVRIKRNGGDQYLFNLLLEMNNISKTEAKLQILKEIERMEVKNN